MYAPNDLINKDNRQIPRIEKVKVYNAVKAIKSTSIILLVDAKTKKVIKQISIAKPAEEIIKEIKAAQDCYRL